MEPIKIELSDADRDLEILAARFEAAFARLYAACEATDLLPPGVTAFDAGLDGAFRWIAFGGLTVSFRPDVRSWLFGTGCQVRCIAIDDDRVFAPLEAVRAVEALADGLSGVRWTTPAADPPPVSEAGLSVGLCPFCGGRPTFYFPFREQKPHGCYVDCSACGAKSPWGGTVREAVDAWNRRVPAGGVDPSDMRETSVVRWRGPEEYVPDAAQQSRLPVLVVYVHREGAMPFVGTWTTANRHVPLPKSVKAWADMPAVPAWLADASDRSRTCRRIPATARRRVGDRTSG